MLQSHTVYSNVSKGVLAKSKDLIKSFGTDDETKICLEVSNCELGSVNVFLFFVFFNACLVNWVVGFVFVIRFWIRVSFKLPGKSESLSCPINSETLPPLLWKKPTIRRLNALIPLV